MPENLSVTDRQLLVRLEARVDQGLSGTDDALESLLEIRQRGLFLPAVADVAGGEAEKWSAYLRRRWPVGERHLRRLLAADRVGAALDDSGRDEGEEDQFGPGCEDAPAPVVPVRKPNESQARELNRLAGRPEAQRQVWREALREAEAAGKRVTARLVRASVDRLLAAEEGADPTPEEARERQGELAARSLAASYARAADKMRKGLTRMAGEVEGLEPGKREAMARLLTAAIAVLGAG